MRAVGIILGFVVAGLAAYVVWGMVTAEPSMEGSAKSLGNWSGAGPLKNPLTKVSSSYAQAPLTQTRSGAGHF